MILPGNDKMAPTNKSIVGANYFREDDGFSDPSSSSPENKSNPFGDYDPWPLATEGYLPDNSSNNALEANNTDGGHPLGASSSGDQTSVGDIFSYYTTPYESCKNYTMLPLCHNPEPADAEVSGGVQYAFIIEIVVPIIFGLVVLVGLFGNTLVVIVIIANRQMRSTTNYLIFSLAVADLLFIVFCVPFTATDYILPSWPFGEVWCKVVQYLTYVTAYASVFTLLLLSIDRYFAVVHPIHAISIRTEQNAVYAIVCTWTVILLSCVPIYIVHGIKTGDLEGNEYAYCTFLTQDYSHAAFRIGFICTMYFIPLIVIVFLYVKILHRLWNRGRPGGISSAESIRSKKRVTKMVVIVVVTFIVCWLPIQMVLLLKSLGVYEMSAMGIIFQVGAQVFAYINSCLNPILYAFLSDPFRKAFRKIIYFSPRRRSDGHGQIGQNGGEDGLTSAAITRLASFKSRSKKTRHPTPTVTELSEVKSFVTATRKTPSPCSRPIDVSNLSEMVYCGPTESTPLNTKNTLMMIDGESEMKQLKPTSLQSTESVAGITRNNNNGVIERRDLKTSSSNESAGSAGVEDVRATKPVNQAANECRRPITEPRNPRTKKLKDVVPPAVPPRRTIGKQRIHELSVSIQKETSKGAERLDVVEVLDDRLKSTSKHSTSKEICSTFNSSVSHVPLEKEPLLNSCSPLKDTIDG